jgi:hypothetical protein
MSHAVNLPDQIIAEARRHALINDRSVPKQLAHWFRIGKIAEENPDLPYGFIKSILLSEQEIADGDVTEYEFG